MGQRILISYEGQPLTCYACNEPGHQFNDCPYKKPTMTDRIEKNKNTWATVVTRRTIQRETMDEEENEEETIPNTDVKTKEDDTLLMERQTNQQQNEKTDPTIIPKSPTTVEEKQDAACESERVDDEETAMDVKQHCKTDMDPNDMEHDQVNEPISK